MVGGACSEETGLASTFDGNFTLDDLTRGLFCRLLPCLEFSHHGSKKVCPYTREDQKESVFGEGK